MFEIHTSQPSKNQMKTIFPKQEEIKIKRGYQREENTSHLPKKLSQMFAKEHLVSKEILRIQKRLGGSGNVV